MATREDHESKLDLRGDDADQVRVMNLGGESSTTGAPVVISHGLRHEFMNDPVAHEIALRENPPAAGIPAQDPTPIDDLDEVPVGTTRDYAAQGGRGEVRRVHDRTPRGSYEDAQRPYNLDTSVAQRSGLSGQDAAEETAEGKRAEGARDRVAEGAKADAKTHEEERGRASQSQKRSQT